MDLEQADTIEIEPSNMAGRQDFIDLGHGVPVILLHSSMTNKQQWFKLTQGLKSRYRVISIDLYGYGDCAFPSNPSDFSLTDEADRIIKLVSAITGGTEYHIVGHSYGGAAALQCALDDQERILSVSCFEPVAFHLFDKSDPAYLAIASMAREVRMALLENDLSSSARIFVDYWSGNGTYASLNPVRQNLLDQVVKKVALDFQATVSAPLSLKDYESLTAPTCLIAGKKSRAATQKITRLLASAIKECEYHEVDTDHMGPVSDAEEVNEILYNFISRIQ